MQRRKNREREHRIDNEILVEAYDEEERAMSWYYHAENAMRFPFPARCLQVEESSPLRKGEEVEVIGLPSEESCRQELRVRVRWQGRTLAVPLKQLKPIKANQKTEQLIEDWHYWTRMGYQF
ncbi:MAG: calcium-binding protein [Acidobacteriaceae bacterium]|nr:calcium-binding protein [Acidobacteriaceae bacterium]